MKFTIEAPTYRLELSRRNLEVLLAKLDDPCSARTLCKLTEFGDEPLGEIMVRAVEHGSEFTIDEAPRYRANVPRRELVALLDSLDAAAFAAAMKSKCSTADLVIVAVENDAHYSDRPPGEMYMPSTGEYV